MKELNEIVETRKRRGRPYGPHAKKRRGRHESRRPYGPGRPRKGNERRNENGSESWQRYGPGRLRNRAGVTRNAKHGLNLARGFFP